MTTITLPPSSGNLLVQTDASGNIVEYTKLAFSADAANPTPVSTSNGLPTAPLAQEVHLGETGQNQFDSQSTPTITASAYAAGNNVGGKLTIANAVRVSGSVGAAGTGLVLVGITIATKFTNTSQIDVVVYNADPTNTTFTDKSAFTMSTSDLAKGMRVLHVTDWTKLGTLSIGYVECNLPISLASATSAYASMVAQGAFTPGSTTDLTITFHILRT